MRNLLIFAFFLISLITHSQENTTKKDSLVWSKSKTCEDGDEDAKKDFNNGIYNSYSYGLLVSVVPKKSEIGFDVFYEDYLRKKYSINLEHRGCIITDYSSCYSQTMDKLINEKFGESIFKRARKEAKKLFKKKQIL